MWWLIRKSMAPTGFKQCVIVSRFGMAVRLKHLMDKRAQV